MMISDIQNDFKNGLTINEVCNKYGLTFKELVSSHMRKKAEINPKKCIRYRNGGFILQKTINGKAIYFGFYDSLETAEKVKAMLIKYDWNKDYLPLIHKKLGVKEYGSSE